MSHAPFSPVGIKHDLGPTVDLAGVPTIPPDVAQQLQTREEPTPKEKSRADAAIAAAVKEIRERKKYADILSPRGNRSYWMDAPETDDDEETKPIRR